MKVNHYKLLILVFFISSIALAQQRSISGTVTDSNGLPIPGVNVIIKNTNRGTQTDFDGVYSVEAANGEIIMYSFLGYVSQEISITSQNKIDVILKEDVSALEEVVVVGFGTQSRRKITANIASISSDKINEIPTPSLQSTLTGKAAGVQVTQLNGKVEGGVKVRVRGISTISSSQEPLYVVDGIPITNSDESINDSPINPLIALNPNDIESIDILKDASSAAIYGARGTNGVIIITTKQGKQGKTKVSLNSSYGISSATNTRDWLNAEQYVELVTESALNVGFTQAGIEGQFDFYANGLDWRNGDVDTDWQELALVDGSVQDFGVSVSGGSEKTRFFMSTAYNNTDGIVRGNQLERYSFRTNIDHTLSEKFRVGTNSSVSKSIIDRISNDNAFATPLQAIAQTPLSPAYLADGVTPNNESTEYYNFLTDEFNGNFKTNIWRVLANVYAEYKILPELSFRSEIGYDFLSQVAERFSGSLTESASVGGFGTANAVQTEKYNLNNYLTYTKRFNEIFDFETTLGMSYEDSQRRLQFAQGQGFPSDDLQTLNSAAEITAGGSSRTRFNFLSYFGRTTFSIADKYLFNASLRYDGSSRFGDENRFGWFPAASVGWIVSEESFLNSSEVVSLLKLRGSWGITGNAGIGNFASLSLFQGTPYNQRAGLAPTQLGNPALKWEKTTQVDIGLDFGFLNNRISGEIDYYVKDTDDLLLNEPVPGTSGFPNITRNVGEMKNRGFEFIINTKNIVSADGSWSTSLNLSTIDNEVTKLPGGDIIAGRNIVREGETVSSFYVVEFAGADPANGDALFIRNTVNADGTIDRSTTNNFNEADRIIAGSPYPDFIAGLTNNISYKGIDFAFTFQGEWGASLYNNGGRFQSGNARFFDNQTTDQLRRWQQPGDITDVPQARLFATNGQQASTRYLQESDFIRLRNLTLGYTIPQDVTKKFYMERVRIYFTGFNLLTFTDYDGYDPESTADFNGDSNIQVGETFYSAPPAKTYTLGINIDF
ncbi:TonB-linked outer membrane protein, SusC/RagA family [Aquimarina amphilecti]|uniref:TonB-linked outer membrane protein, SusC/RagA family n=1 Tax=Aquimarina amphilecti TaxID=1038014 RepID=A0A1H7PT14_AQUAM|nr:TonB-dependent receptor [Aquimarina amphilecti]SEL39031.1 TonB-linked outer membrane protein, SusC/RagA family [Aquimarina amphilecti]